jgi:hypothetical protein
LPKTLKNIPPIHERTNNDPEWTTKQWTFRKDITSNLAKCTISQSPYVYPEKLEKVVCYLDACLVQSVDWEIKTDAHNAMTELSLCDIARLLYDILWDMKEFQNWNMAKKGKEEIKFVSSHDGPGDPNTDFIDLDALITNVCIEIRTHRRENDRFDKEFKKKYNQQSSR